MATAPDALHVGFSKCASTFLQNFFESHPEIFLVNQSHFFSPFDLCSYSAGPDPYRQLFSNAPAGSRTLESDEHILLPLFHPTLHAAATTIQSVEDVIYRIKGVQPDAKIIVVIRNQVDLIASRYSEYVIGGGRHDFDFFVSEFLQCRQDGKNYYANYYDRIIGLLEENFGARNVLTLLQEELLRDETGAIERLCRFLDIRAVRPRRRGRMSRRIGLSRTGIAIMRAFNTLVIVRQEMSTRKAQVRIPYLIYKVIQRTIRIVDSYLPDSLRGSKRVIMPETILQRLRDEFAEDNARLGKRLNRDLTALGYCCEVSAD